jgi:acetyltransferase-like isoleucine patch superfamily enzyme
MHRLKNIIKKHFGHVRCIIAHISYDEGNIYIGKNVNIQNGRNIKLSNGVSIRPYVDLWCNPNSSIVIKAGSEIGERCRISIANSLNIGENVLLSPNIYITDCDHRYDLHGIPVMNQGIIESNNKVVIEDHAFIGINCVIVGNVRIGRGSVIGANSVVTSDIPDYCVAVGIPCRVKKRYNEQTSCWDNT